MKTISAVESDGLGNTLSTFAGTYGLDTGAPVVHLTSEVSSNGNPAQATAGDVITETFTASDLATWVASTSVTIDGQAATVVHGVGDNYTATYTVQAGDINGAAGVSITATDLVGNETTVTATGSVTVDTHAPAVAITSSGGFTNQATQTISGTGEAGTTVTILDGATTLGTATVAGDGTWSSAVTLSG